ncbi:HlyD family secretion protein [Aureimonas sp. AU12]|uniref:HlyD family secretion protein n=1 Tax=Aureimonas sp. AU12 TaxID=1638161 RepID=UPI0007812C53|nr:HlyD family secretion protein [Aureimonas sp. AU12]
MLKSVPKTDSATDATEASLPSGETAKSERDALKLEVIARKGSEAEAKAPSPPAAAPITQAPAKTTKKGGGLKKLVLSCVLLAAIGGGAWYGHHWWVDGRFLVTTDDAYVSADMAIMTPKVTGYVASVPVVENQTVKAGQPIVEIDPGDYALALRSAEAKIDTQSATIERIRAERAAADEAVAEAQANKVAAEAAQAQADLDLQRAQSLVRSGAGAQAPLDSARSAQAEANAKVAGTNAAIASARAQGTVLDAQIKEAEATGRELAVDRDVAARNLSFTTLRAPYDGVIGNLAVQPGDLVSSSRRLAAIVPLDKVFVDANFKETQVHEIVAGEKARIEVDALPGVEVSGTVVSISPASGSVFSLLPADNATGNFTKIVQRVPVRIAIDPADAHSGKLRPGLSVTVSVDQRTAPGAAATTAAAE